MKILGRRDRAMTDLEFLGFVDAMTREMAEIAHERGMRDLAKSLREAYRCSQSRHKPVVATD